MKNFTKICYHSFIIVLLIFIALPAVVIDKANAEDLYEEQAPFSEANSHRFWRLLPYIRTVY